MISKLGGTFLTRVLVSLLNFLLIMLSTHWVGAEGRGIISIFIANMALIILISGFVGGASLVYLASRTNYIALILPIYIWIVFSSVAAGYILMFTGWQSSENFWLLIISAILNGFMATNMALLLGKEKVKIYNYLTLLQVCIQLTWVLYQKYICNTISIHDFLVNNAYSYVFIIAISLYFLSKNRDKFEFKISKSIIKELTWRSGAIQSANVVQFFNYRLSFYFLQKYIGNRELGIFSVAISIAESIWIIGRSFASVLYARISNLDSEIRSKRLTIRMLQFNTIVNLVAVLFLIVLPTAVYRTLFGGSDFDTVKFLILLLSPGILLLGIYSTLLAPYFSGNGIYRPIIISSTLGLVLTIASAFTLIRPFGLIGAAVSNSLGYSLLSMYLIYVFCKKNEMHWREILPDSSFLILMRKLVRKVFWGIKEF
jgi:O-antigen/teichoic acid export membrane protein